MHFIFRRYFSSSLASKSKLVILGPPGSGKGTISERIVRDFKLKHLSSGDVLRSHIANKTEFGLKIKPLVDAGKLVPSDILVPMIASEINKIKDSGMLLDGFPRSIDQAISLHKLAPPDLAIQLDVPFQTIIERISCRWVHLPSARVYNLEFSPPKVAGKDDVTGEPLVQRDDDKPETVKQRLEVYQNLTLPILEYYKEKGILQVFSGTESNVIYPQIKTFLEKWEPK